MKMLTMTRKKKTNTMKYARLASRIYGRPVLITEMEYFNLSNTFQSLVKGNVPKALFDDDEGENATSEPYKVVGKTAIVSLSGPIIKHASGMDTLCGMVDVDTFLSNVQAAFNDTNVTSILIDIVSPGGECTGIFETSNAIREMSKTKDIVAFSDDMCCSAAFWIASACNSIVVTETSTIGSVGVFIGLYDQSQAFAQEGIRPILIRSRQFKADGFPGLPISKETIDRLQTDVDDVNAMFRSAIALKRTLKDEDMQGQAFSGTKAVANGMADMIVANIGELVELMNTELN